VSTITPTGTPEVMADGRALFETGKYDNYDGKSSARLYSQHQASKGVISNLDWHNDKWHLTGILSYSTAATSSVESEFDLRTVPLPGGNGLTSTINTGFGSLGAFSQVATAPNNGPQQAIYAMPFYDATGGHIRPAYGIGRTRIPKTSTPPTANISSTFQAAKASPKIPSKRRSWTWSASSTSVRSPASRAVSVSRTTTTTAAASATWPMGRKPRTSPRPC